MKKIVLSALIILLGSVIAGLPNNWSDPIFISDGMAPDLDIDTRTGHLHVIAIKEPNIIYTEIDENGVQLFQETVPGANHETANYYRGASVAVDTLGFPHIAFREKVGDFILDLYYIYKTEAGWSDPLKIASGVTRGYSFRIDIDEANQVHLAYGSIEGEDVWGPVTYKKIIAGEVVNTIEGIEKYRGDDRIEIDARGNGNVNLILGCPDTNGGPVTYWRSTDGGETMTKVGNVISGDALDRNGAPDIFVDKTGGVHICYGVKKDASIHSQQSLRYTRYVDAQKQSDVIVTPNNLLEEWGNHALGLGSVAASDNGENVVIAFLQKDGGILYSVYSDDYGRTWNDLQTLSSEEFKGYEGRNIQFVRANKGNFYVVYPDHLNKIRLRYLTVPDINPPDAAAGGPYAGNEGDLIQFDASQSTDDTEIDYYEWDWQGDGVFDDSSKSPIIEHRYQDDYSGIAVLKVYDVGGKTGLDTANVIVSNLPPVPAAISNQEANEGQQLAFTGTATDPGVLDTFEFRWLFGDGDSTSGPAVNHSYVDNGTYTVTLKVIDDDGGVGQVQATAEILNVAPTAEAGGPYSGRTNEAVTFTGAAADPGTADTLIYEWDFNGDNTFELLGQQVDRSFPNSGTFQVMLRVIDEDGGVGLDTTGVTITSQSPEISGLQGQTIDEGAAFSTINLDECVTDADNADDEIAWSVFGNIELGVSIVNRIATIAAPADSEWSGTEMLTFVAADPDDHTDSATVAFTVNPINDPPVALIIPDQTIDEGQAFAPFNLDDHVTDPDNVPDQMIWSFSGNTDLIVTLNHSQSSNSSGKAPHRVENSLVWQVTIAAPDSEWSGSERITFIVEDPGGLKDSVSAQYTVNPINDAPQISEIPDQIISNQAVFPELHLDDYVFDPDHADSLLSWNYSGNTELIVALTERVVSVSLPSQVWSGTEKITFTVSDPAGLSAHKEVSFIVNRDNEPPVIAAMSNVAFNEDDTLGISLGTLQALVTDPDNDPEDFLFSLAANQNVFAAQDREKLYLYATADWNGKESVKLVVSDGSGGRDSTDWNITVNPQNDAPDSFSLLSPLDEDFSGWPLSITFTWQKANDPDEGQAVAYIFLIAKSETFADTIFTTTVFDTSYRFTPATFENGTYYWKIYAFSSGDGLFTVGDNVGHFNYTSVSVDSRLETRVPDNYELCQNHPNPFNPLTRINYALPKNSMVKLVIYNTVGQLVRILENGYRSAGIHTATWDGCNEYGQKVCSGVYIYQLEAGKLRLTKKMLLAK